MKNRSPEKIGSERTPGASVPVRSRVPRLQHLAALAWFVGACGTAPATPREPGNEEFCEEERLETFAHAQLAVRPDGFLLKSLPSSVEPAWSVEVTQVATNQFLVKDERGAWGLSVEGDGHSLRWRGITDLNPQAVSGGECTRTFNAERLTVDCPLELGTSGLTGLQFFPRSEEAGLFAWFQNGEGAVTQWTHFDGFFTGGNSVTATTHDAPENPHYLALARLSDAPQPTEVLKEKEPIAAAQE